MMIGRSDLVDDEYYWIRWRKNREYGIGQWCAGWGPDGVFLVTGSDMVFRIDEVEPIRHLPRPQ